MTNDELGAAAKRNQSQVNRWGERPREPAPPKVAFMALGDARPTGEPGTRNPEPGTGKPCNVQPKQPLHRGSSSPKQHVCPSRGLPAPGPPVDQSRSLGSLRSNTLRPSIQVSSTC